jgi:hypothetical protein
MKNYIAPSLLAVVHNASIDNLVHFIFSMFILLFCMLGIKSIALHMLGKHSTTELHPQPWI